MSAKKGTLRFYTPELRAAVATYLSVKERLDAALRDGARRLYARFSGQFARWHRAMLSRGVYLAPSQYEAGFMSLAHTEEDVDATIAAAKAVFAEI